MDMCDPRTGRPTTAKMMDKFLPLHGLRLDTTLVSRHRC